MIYLVYGTNRHAQQVAIDDIQKELVANGFVYKKVQAADFSESDFEQEFFGISMFGGKLLIVLDGVCGDQRGGLYIERMCPSLLATENVLILQEESLSPKFLAAIEPFCFRVLHCKEAKTAPDFSLWNAVYAHKKREAWQAYISEQSKKDDDAAQIHGAIFSQYKNIYKAKIAEEGATYEEAGFEKASVFALAKAAGERYEVGELENIVHELVALPYYARNEEGGTPLSVLLERFILKYV